MLMTLMMLTTSLMTSPIRMASEWPASSYADDADDADDFPDDLPNPNGTRMACELVCP